MANAARDRIFPFELKNKGEKTALVAGGAGFVGSYICEQLLDQGFKVICVDNLTSGSKQNVQNFLNRPEFTFIRADLNSPSFNLSPESRLDLVFHAAGLEEFSIDKELSLETLLVNSLGSRVLLELAKDQKARFVFVSSAELYSGVFSSTSLRYYFGRDAASESTFTHNEAKRFAEALVFEYFKNYGLDAVVVRVKDVYGPRMTLQAEGVVNKLVAEAVEGKKLTIAGDGLKTLNPTFVTDVGFGIAKAALSGSKGEIYNLVNPNKLTVKAFAHSISQVVGGLEISHKKAEEDLGPPYHELDLSTSIERLGWRPGVGLADGIAQTVNYFRTHKKEEQNVSASPVFSTGNKKVAGGRGVFKIFALSHLRLLIFLAALLLVVLTVVYPGAAIVLSTHNANSDFESAFQNLESDRAGTAIDKAQKAGASYKKASQSLQSLDWFLKIILSKERLNALNDFYFVGENFSTSSVYTAQAVKVLIDTADKEQLSTSDLSSYLSEISNNIDKAETGYSLAASTLARLNNADLPKALSDDWEVMKQMDTLLEELIAELSDSTGT